MTITTESLIQDLQRLHGTPCKVCHAPLCLHQLLMGIALGFRNAPRCLPCLGAALERDPCELPESVIAYIHQRECFDSAWKWATQVEAAEGGKCEFAKVEPPVRSPGLSRPGRPEGGTSNAEMESQSEWDAGDLGCGELVLELRLRLEGMEPGQVIKLCARDPGAPEDLPAWCRLTGHRLRAARHPCYWIERKEKNAR